MITRDILIFTIVGFMMLIILLETIQNNVIEGQRRTIGMLTQELREYNREKEAKNGRRI